jgi:hypothetical protein
MARTRKNLNKQKHRGGGEKKQNATRGNGTGFSRKNVVAWMKKNKKKTGAIVAVGAGTLLDKMLYNGKYTHKAGDHTLGALKGFHTGIRKVTNPSSEKHKRGLRTVYRETLKGLRQGDTLRMGGKKKRVDEYNKESAPYTPFGIYPGSYSIYETGN